MRDTVNHHLNLIALIIGLLPSGLRNVTLSLRKLLLFLDAGMDPPMYSMTSDIGPMTIDSAGAGPGAIGTMAKRSSGMG
jgi:hypothetical protein